MFKRYTLAFAALLFGTAAFAAKPPVFATDDGAIRGYDPVAYFTQKKPVKGGNEHTFEYMGATWHFVSEENRDLFAASPDTYAPQFGGYCAYAVGNGYTASVDPTAWTVVDDRLYLNYSKGVQSSWEAKRDHYISEANRNWPRVLKE